MSGGHFDYSQHRFENDFVRPFEKYILDIEDARAHPIEEPKDYFSEECHRYFMQELKPETVKQFKTGLLIMKMAVAYAQRIDWFLSGDDGEESFHERLKDELEKACISCKDISDKFAPNPNQETKVFEYTNKYTRATIGVGYDSEGYIDWATVYSIETKPQYRRQGHASLMLDYIKNYEDFYCLQSSVTLNDAATALMNKNNIKIIEHGENQPQKRSRRKSLPTV